MGVPFHDERDCAFALENQLDLVQVINEEEKLCNSGRFNGLQCKEAQKAIMEEV